MQFTTAPIKQVFTFPFQDEKWKNKLLIGLAVILAGFIIPVVPTLILFGYIYQIMHRVINGDGQLYLPEWEDWGKLLKEGWRLFCVYFIYTLPAMLIMSMGTIIYFVGVTMISAMGGSELSNAIIGFLFIAIAIFFLSLLIGMILLLLASFFLPPALCHTVRKESFTAGFDFGGFMKVLRVNLGGFLIALILMFGLYTAVMYFAYIFYMTMVLCCFMYVVAIIGGFYMLLVGAGLLALVYREGMEKLATG